MESFNCGNEELSEWLKQHAFHAVAQGTRTYVLVDNRSGSVDGYFAITPHMVAREDIPARVGRGAPGQIPAILLAKLALDRSAQGRGLGAELLVRALRMIVDAARIAGGKLVVVDAIDKEAISFYKHHDFESFAKSEARLVMKLSTVAKALDLPWP